MYALCVSGAVNTQGFGWKFFLCAIYKFSFIHSIHNQIVMQTIFQAPKKLQKRNPNQVFFFHFSSFLTVYLFSKCHFVA